MKAKTQKQKKINSTLFIVAMVLFAAVLVSSAFVAGTFAKYTTSTGTQTETAQVAKWGVTLDVTGDGLFSTSYTNGDAKIQSGDTDKVVAPNASGGINIAISGTPEENFAVKISYTITYGTGWNDIGTGTGEDFVAYRPIAFTSGNAIDFTTNTIINANLQTVTTGSFTQDYEENSTITTTDIMSTDETPTVVTTANVPSGILWNWNPNLNDTLDTLAGNRAAGVDGFDASTMAITVVYSITIEQII